MNIKLPFLLAIWQPLSLHLWFLRTLSRLPKHKKTADFYRWLADPVSFFNSDLALRPLRDKPPTHVLVFTKLNPHNFESFRRCSRHLEAFSEAGLFVLKLPTAVGKNHLVRTRQSQAEQDNNLLLGRQTFTDC